MEKEKKVIMGIETKSIDYIPPEDRYGHPKNQFYIWFGAGMSLLTVATGAFAPSIGLNLAWSIAAIVVGLLIGALFMAFHSAQGPHLGIPQMIQSRAQFGVIGAVVPLVIVIVLFLGFFSSSVYYSAQNLAPIKVPMSLSIIIVVVITIIIGIYGYEMIHRTEKYSTYISAIVFLVITIFAVQLPLPEGSMTLGPVNICTFLLAVGVYVNFYVTAAPYVADYSRYLPVNTSIASTFWYTYLGAVCSGIWLCILGAILFIAIPDFTANSAVAVASQWKLPLPIIVYVVMTLAAAFSATLSLYGIFMAIVTVFSPFTSLRGSKKAKIIIMVITGIVACCIDIFGASNMVMQWGYFMSILLYFMIPWTSINLVDYYFVRKGKYSLEDIFDPNGIYGKYNWRTLGTYFATIVIEIPFMSTVFYTGRVAKALGGADIAWIVGGLFAAILYYVLCKNAEFDRKGEEK